jgi:hypothetical protein
LTPRTRRKVAVWLLIISLVFGHLNFAAFAFGLVPATVMNAITNYLSWLAISLTALDVLFTSDVRVNQEEE